MLCALSRQITLLTMDSGFLRTFMPKPLGGEIE